MAAITIRPYRSQDRGQVRQICYATGHMGRSIAWDWQDAESFADLFCGYFTDHEPESALVAQRRGRVVGYLLGSVDSSRIPGPADAALRHALGRGMIVSPGTAGFFWRALFDLLADLRRGPGAAFDDPRWPALLHINLLPEARGGGAGRLLMQRYLARLRQQGVPGVHLGAFAENLPALAFFERMGFARHGHPRPAPGIRARDGARMHSQVMVQTLTPGERDA